MKQWILFIFSRSFLRSLLRIAGVWLLLLGGLWFYLKFYSRPGAIQVLPNLRGMKLVEAQDALEELGLEAVHLDSIYSRNGSPFEVIEQVPPPGDLERRVRECVTEQSEKRITSTSVSRFNLWIN